MLVVADSSPIIVLANIQCIELLPKLFGSILIPPEVTDELTRPKRPKAVKEFIASPPSWLQIRSPRIIEAFVDRHPGEASAISLAREIHADLLLIDEIRGRKVAAELNLRLTGTIGLLESAAEANLINLSEIFARLKQTNFWVPTKFLDQRLQFHLSKTRPQS